MEFNETTLRKIRSNNKIKIKNCLRYHKTSDEAFKKTRSDQIYQKNFVTDSKYEGQWSSPLTMDGYGTYTFSHGVKYEGEFYDGQFHGKGKLIYPNGQVLSGIYDKGKLIKWDYTFKDGGKCNFDTYCISPDRRYFNEYQLEGGKFLQSTTKILDEVVPSGHYDVGDGYYNPKTSWVHKKDDLNVFVRNVTPNDVPLDLTQYLPDGMPFVKKIPRVPIYRNSKWIEANCKRSKFVNRGLGDKNLESEKIPINLDRDADKNSNCVKMLMFFEETSKLK